MRLPERIACLSTETVEAVRIRLVSVLQTIPDMVWLKDTEGVFLECNHAFARFVGRKECDIIGKTDYDLVDAERAAFFHSKDQKALAADCVCLSEEWLLSADTNTPVLLEVRKMPMRDADGKLIGVLSIGRDITARRRMEQDLARREREFRSLAENSPDNITRYDRHCRIRYMNPNVAAELGISAADAFGKTPSECNPCEASVGFERVVRQVITSGQAADHYFPWFDPEGRESYQYVTMTPEFDEQGAIVGVLVIGRDISERIRIERDLAESRAQIRALAARREEIREAERKHVAREVHDELGQILTGLHMNVSLLAHKLGENSERLATHLRDTVALTNQALDVSRTIASALRPAALDMGIVPALEWLVDRFKSSTDVHCVLQVKESDIQLDENHAIALFRILQEALTNITKHANADRVEIALDADTGQYVLRVRDNGMGFDANAKKANSFGLIGIRERALMLGGEVSIDSKPGSGTEIVVRIPAMSQGKQE